MVVLIFGVRFLGMDSTLRVGFGINPKATWAFSGEPRRTTVACKVSLVEQLDQSMFTVALDGAGIADTGSVVVGLCGVLSRGGWVARHAGKNSLAEAPKRFRTTFNALRSQ